MSIADGKYVITQDGCPHCTTFKEENKELFENGFKEKNLTNLKEGSPWWDLLQNLNIAGTPSVIDVKDGKACEVDSSNPNGSGTKCVSLSAKAPERTATLNDYITSKIS